MALGPATTADLSDRSLTTLTAEQLTVGAVKLDDAYIQIIAAIPSVVARLAATPTDPIFTALVVQVQCAAVIRFLNNPDGKYQETVDDYSFSRDKAVATGEIYISESELALLSATGGSVNAFTITPAGRAPGFPFPGFSEWS
jgi:hypothetical protein